MIKYLLLGIAALIVLFIAFLIVRAAAFKPKAGAKVNDEPEEFDKDITVERLQKLIRFKTVSYRDSSLEDDTEFKKLLASLPELYPNVFKVCEYSELADRALLFRWKGQNEGDPAVLMAHYDVVPVNEEGWSPLTECFLPPTTSFQRALPPYMISILHFRAEKRLTDRAL